MSKERTYFKNCYIKRNCSFCNGPHNSAICSRRVYPSENTNEENIRQINYSTKNVSYVPPKSKPIDKNHKLQTWKSKTSYCQVEKTIDKKVEEPKIEESV